MISRTCMRMSICYSRSLPHACMHACMHTRRYAPEMAQMRDVAFLTKMMVTDPHSLRESLRKEEHGVVRRSWLKNKIINPSSLLPTWEVTSGVNLRSECVLITDMMDQEHGVIFVRSLHWMFD